MANWKEYTTKTTPEDADEIVIADTKANANKRTPFSGIWNWIANKLATAVISQLETQNKSIIPALNELNSKSPICSVMHGETDSEGTFKIAIPLDSFWICSFHDKSTNIGGIVIGITSFNSSIAYSGTHNNATIRIEGNANDGTKFYTNCSTGKYTIAIFKNYSMK